MVVRDRKRLQSRSGRGREKNEQKQKSQYGMKKKKIIDDNVEVNKLEKILIDQEYFNLSN